MITSKSPRKVAMVALAAGMEAFSDYSHKFSPRKFTRPQLFACLVLKEHQKKDYRGIVELLADCPDLQRAIRLKSVPHVTTLQKASQRLLKLQSVRPLLARTLKHVQRRRKNVAYAAGDSSGFEATCASCYFVWRRDNQQHKGDKRPQKRLSYRRFGKLMLIVCCRSHAILAAVAWEGPTPDIDQLDEVLGELPTPAVTIRHLLLDAGFDSAYNHHLLREEHGIRSTIPPEHGRPAQDPTALPRDPWRRLMKQRFNLQAYRRRSQVETVFSMLKRNFGSALRAKTRQGRRRDLRLRVLTHNIALALKQLFYRAILSP